MKIEDNNIVKGYEEAGREWSGRKTNGDAPKKAKLSKGTSP